MKIVRLMFNGVGFTFRCQKPDEVLDEAMTQGYIRLPGMDILDSHNNPVKDGPELVFLRLPFGTIAEVFEESVIQLAKTLPASDNLKKFRRKP